MSQAIDPRPKPSEDPTPYLSHPDARYEVEDGQVVEKPSTGAFAYVVAMNLYNQIRDFLGASPIGVAAIETMFILDAVRDLRRNPDVAFISFDRWAAGRDVPEEGDWDVVPDLMVEIISPNDRAEKVARKLKEYFRYGVRQVWLLYPQGKRIEVHRSPKDIHILDADDELDGGDVLPGFRAAVGPLFRRTLG